MPPRSWLSSWAEGASPRNLLPRHGLDAPEGSVACVRDEPWDSAPSSATDPSGAAGLPRGHGCRPRRLQDDSGVVIHASPLLAVILRERRRATSSRAMAWTLPKDLWPASVTNHGIQRRPRLQILQAPPGFRADPVVGGGAFRMTGGGGVIHASPLLAVILS